MKKLSLVLVLVLFALGTMIAQRTISGTINDDQGEPLIGANVLVKGTTTGTVTDIDGNYKLSVPEGSNTLVVSYTGYNTQELELGASNIIDVTLATGVLLSDVVVTALGIEREERSLGYSVQEVQGDEITKVPTTNFMNNLSGKVSGVQIRANNNFGGSTNVVMRGNSSITGNNQALFVIDGIPVDNSNKNTRAQRAGSTGYDYGNAATDINPADIESINVLKGAAATALYGSRAANGAVIITTKKGVKRKGIGVSVNSSATFGKIDKETFIKYQDQYGAGYGPYYGSTGYFEDYDVDGDGTMDLVVPTYDDASYGQKFDPNLMVYQWESFIPESDKFGKPYPYVAAKNTPAEFFETEATFSNTVALSGGIDKGTFRLAYTNYNTEGVMPNSELTKHNVNFSSSYDLTDRLTASFVGNYLKQDATGRNSTGYSDNLMSQFRQWWQVNVDMVRLKELYDLTGRNVTWNSVAPWEGNFTPQYWDNPYWTRFENFQTDERSRLIGSFSLTYDLTDWLNVLGRYSVDTYNDLREERRAVGSVPAPFGVTRNDASSGYQRYDLDFTETNFDVMLNAEKDLNEDFSVRGLLGMNIRKATDERVLASTNGGLVVPGLYSLSNSVGSLPLPVENLFERQVNGYYAAVSLGYRDFLYLDITDRIDQSSTLPVDNNTYNYYSISASFVFSKLLSMNTDADWLNFSKLRLSYAEVGNDAPPQSVSNTYPKLDNFGSAISFSVNSTLNNPDLKPERTKSVEVGLEMNFLDRRLGFDVAYYKNNTIDNIMPVSVSRATGYTRQFVNSGEVENKGIEVSLNLVPLRMGGFEWATGVNWTRNRNKVLSLYEGVENLQLRSYQGGVSLNATKGKPYGTIRGTGLMYDDNGNRVVGENGYYIAVADQVIGNVNPDWIGGWHNTFSYNNIGLSFLIDMQKGGDVYSLDQHYGQGTGLPDYTAGLNDLGNPVRDPVDQGGGVLLEGVKEDGTPNDIRVPADYFGGAYYWGNASRNPGELTIYDGGFIKLRELALSYTFKSGVFNGALQNLTLAAVGRNLWIIDKDLPFADPESGLSSGNDQGYISGSYPTVRTIGFNLNFDF